MASQATPGKRSGGKQEKKPPTTETFGARVQRLMEGLGYNQTTFAAKVGMDRTELNRTLSGKRQPRPEELIWIAQALGLGVEALLDGLELPPVLRKTRDELQELTRRVLDAEAERNRLRDELAARDAEVIRARDAWQKEQARLLAATAKVREDYDTELGRVRKAAEARERALSAALNAAEANNSQLQVALHQATAQANRNYRAVEALNVQLQGTQQQVAQERSNKVTTGVLVGLAGILLGGAMGKSSTDDDDDDDDEN